MAFQAPPQICKLFQGFVELVDKSGESQLARMQEVRIVSLLAGWRECATCGALVLNKEE